jgi:hypothetical protein
MVGNEIYVLHDKGGTALHVTEVYSRWAKEIEQ